MSSNKRVAIVSDKLAGAMGGAEAIVYAAHELYPEAPLYATVIDHDILPEHWKNLPYRTTFLQHWPMAKKKYKAYFPLMPLAHELLDLQEFDTIFSSHHSVAKGVIPRPDATHICYCHSPARYIWDLFWTYAELSNFNTAQKMMVGAMSQYLRMWDVTSSHRVTKFLANSAYTAQRIKLYYGRDADILHPPVRTTKFYNGEAEDFYLMLGRIVAYKGFGLAVDAFNDSGKKLVIIGDGPDKEELVAKAKSNITFLGRAPDDVMMDQMARCKGFVFPGKEDFGIVMVEAQSAGKPVIALGQGGALDIVRPDETGVLFNEPTIEELNVAIAKNDAMMWDQQAIQDHAEQFNEDLFKQKLQTYIEHGELDGALTL